MEKFFVVLMAVFGTAPVLAQGHTQTIKVEVTETGFVPSSIDVAPGTNVTLEVTRTTEQTCSTEIQIPTKKVGKTALPLGKLVSIALGKLGKGEIRFGCGMNMMDSGKIIVR